LSTQNQFSQTQNQALFFLGILNTANFRTSATIYKWRNSWNI